MPFKQIYQTIDGKIQMVDENGQVFVSSPTPEVTEIGANKFTSAPVAPTNLPMMAIHNLNMEPARDTKVEAPVAFVKMEQLDASSASLSTIPASSQADASSTTTKVSSKSHGSSKPPKKRRSWGQELPEPTTNLPPRKRAKTDAEKEQRRIERVKRNRQAAHNSRERKRQEHESLETENDRLKSEKSALQEEVARLRRQVAELTGNKIVDSPVIPPAKNEDADTMRRFMLQSPHHSPYLQSEALFTAEQLPLMGTVAQVSSSFASQTSTNNTPVLSNSSDFTSPATEELPFTPTIDSLNLGQTRQFAVSPLGTGLDEVIDFGNGTVGDFSLFESGPTSGNINSLWAPSQPINIGSGLHQSPLLHGVDSGMCFTDPSDDLLGEIIEFNEQSYPCANRALREASAAGQDHAVEQS